MLSHGGHRRRRPRCVSSEWIDSDSWRPRLRAAVAPKGVPRIYPEPDLPDFRVGWILPVGLGAENGPSAIPARTNLAPPPRRHCCNDCV